MQSGSQFLYCIPRTQQAKIRQEYRLSYVVGQLNGRPVDSENSFLASMRNLPMNPPARTDANLDALLDSCFGGLMAAPPAETALLWPYADSTKRPVLRFGVALLHSLGRMTGSAERQGVDLALFLVCANPPAAAELDRFFGQDPP